MILQSILELSAKETLLDYVTAIAWSPIGNMLAAASGAGAEPRWQIINFEFETEPNEPKNYTYPFLRNLS
ncbi:MAG: DUF2396 family protein [Symploca sp. SIO2E6]|nr:DUF2396 family protein [Symploca sp. SIO2E6]